MDYKWCILLFMPISKSVSKNEADASATATATEIPAKKKRTPATAKAKNVKVAAESTDTVVTPVPVKGGRKTKGSKIITKQQISGTVTTPPIANVILNLKCSMSDLKEYNNKLSKMISNPLEYNSSVPPEVKYYEGEKSFSEFIRNDQSDALKTEVSIETDEYKKTNKSFASFLSFSAEEANQEEDVSHNPETVDEYTTIEPCVYTNVKISNVKINKNDVDYTPDEPDDVNIKDMSAKLKQLKIQLYKNSLNSEKKSACFWCTYDFDNAPCYIPKYEMDGTIYGYGSFCRPECAVAYLMKETIDDSTKFDRYHLLNQIYSKVYECKKNIKPAPDPHYLLDKFYGNLTIQEYRRLLKTEHLLLVIDKPLTRILPELHEDTDDAFTKIYGIKATSGNSSGVYKVKRQSEQPQGPSKASIMKNTFGIST